VGRLCLFDDDLSWEPEEEDPEISRGRLELLSLLEKAQNQLPDDRWLLAQRIRYLGDVGRWREAETLARGCPGGGWWCDGLLGYVLHRSGDVVGSMEAFSRALASMGPERREEWTDPYPILDYAEGRWLRNPGSLTPYEAIQRFWTLADPLFLTPGNEGLSEHYARCFGPQLYRDSSLTMGLPWGRSFEQLLMRYGFIAGWEQVPAEFGQTGPRNVVEHHHPESRGLHPPFEALEDPAGLPEGVWMPRDERPRSAIAPVRAPLVAEGEAQTALLRRDGDLLVIAAYGLPRDTVLLRRRPREGSLPGADSGGHGSGIPPKPPLWEPGPERLSSDTLAGLFLLSDKGEWAPLAAFGSGGRGFLSLSAPPGGYLVSVEQWNPSGRWGARVRHGMRGDAIPADVPHISDLLLLDVAPRIPVSLQEALPRMRPSTELESGGRFTVAWEVYGLGGRGEPVTFSLSLVEEEGSLVRRALKKIGLFQKDPVLTLRWTEDGTTAPGPLFRALDVDLPHLDTGRYLLRLELSLPFRNTVVSNRRVRVG